MPYVSKADYEQQDRLICHMGEQMCEAQNSANFWRVMCLVQLSATIILNYVGWL